MRHTTWLSAAALAVPCLLLVASAAAQEAPPPPVEPELAPGSDKTGTVIPLADFLYANPYEHLMGSVQRGVYLGIHEAAGVPCHHLSFEQETIDWQLWIDAGKEPLPRKLVIRVSVVPVTAVARQPDVHLSERSRPRPRES